MINKERLNIIWILFFLLIFQLLPVNYFNGIDFIFIGLIYASFYFNSRHILITGIVLLLVLYFMSRRFIAVSVLGYLVIPFIHRRIAKFLRLTLHKYILICQISLFVYILAGLASVNLINFTNVFSMLLKNLVILYLLYPVFARLNINPEPIQA